MVPILASMRRWSAEDVELILREIRVQLVEPLRTARGLLSSRSSVIVELVGDDGISGWGECVTLDGLDYPLASISLVWEWLEANAARWCDLCLSVMRPETDLSQVGPRSDLGTPLNASGAIRDAVLDMQLRRLGQSMSDRLAAGRHRDRVLSARVLPIFSDIGELMVRVEDAVKSGHRHLVCKIAPGWDVEPLRAVSGAYPDLALAADANGSFSADDAVLADLDVIGLSWLEQPVHSSDLHGSAWVADRMDTPVVLDESVTTNDEFEIALRLGSLDGINVKPGRLGGVLTAADLAKRASLEGIDVLVGGLTETGIGRACALAVAAMPEVTLPSDLGPSRRYLDPDITAELPLQPDGTLLIPSGSGCGVNPDPDRIGSLTTRVLELEVEARPT